MQAEIHIFGGPVLVFNIDTETAVHSNQKTPVVSEPQLERSPASFSLCRSLIDGAITP